MTDCYHHPSNCRCPENINAVNIDSAFKELTAQHLNKHDKRIDLLDIGNLGIRDKIKELEEKFNQLESHVKKMTEAYLRKIIKNAIPHKCPICDGHGCFDIAPQNSVDARLNFRCNACEGKGIVWG